MKVTIRIRPRNAGLSFTVSVCVNTPCSSKLEDVNNEVNDVLTELILHILVEGLADEVRSAMAATRLGACLFDVLCFVLGDAHRGLGDRAPRC